MTVFSPVKLLERLEKEPRESTWLEFKVNNADPEEIAQYVSALSNSAMLSDRDRAFVVFGIEDKTRRRVGTGITLGELKKGNEGLLNWLSHAVKPQLMIEFLDFEDAGKRFSIIVMEPSYERPVSAQGVEYIRIGEHKKRLSDHPAEERALWLATGRRRFEDAVAVPNQSPAQILDALDAGSFFELRDEAIPKRTAEIMRRFAQEGLIKDNMEGGFDILNLGAILFAKSLSLFPSVKGKALRIVKYKGKDKRQSDFEEEVPAGYAIAFGPWMSRIAKAMPSEEQYISGIRRMVPLVPEPALREVIANALIHQDFSISGVGPVVEIYENRVEVSNAGSSLIEPDRMLDERRSRNEKLASVMRGLGLCEERGGGLDKTVMTLEQHLLPAPDFISSGHGMRVVLFGKRPFNQFSKQEKIRSCFFHCVVRWISRDFMSNSTLRERFGLSQEEYQAVSAIISQSLKTGRILPADPDQGRRNAKYIPYWAG